MQDYQASAAGKEAFKTCGIRIETSDHEEKVKSFQKWTESFNNARYEMKRLVSAGFRSCHESLIGLFLADALFEQPTRGRWRLRVPAGTRRVHNNQSVVNGSCLG